ncbi:MAG: hypothetical protein AAB728_05760 [Patescibacteria group bacterium]
MPRNPNDPPERLSLIDILERLLRAYDAPPDPSPGQPEALGGDAWVVSGTFFIPFRRGSTGDY